MPAPGDAKLFAAVRERLYTAVVGDVLDRMGRLDHFLPPHIHPITPDMAVVGRAKPVIVEDAPGTLEDPFGRLLEALDSLTEDDVYITNGGASTYALWGELMSTRARHLKAAGAVMNGYHRDTAGILALKFPTFSWGAYAQDISLRGRVVDFNVPTRVGSVNVEPGDIVFGDRDGVLIVPQDLAEDVFGRALEKVNSENLVRDGFRKGMPAVEAFAKYGVM
jgi:4-hydroxy-4-methyl-2-oxoglutarate aldolase